MFRRPHPLTERHADLKTDDDNNDPARRDPFGRIDPPKRAPDLEIADIKKPTTLSSSVGDRGTNKRRDVAKVEKMLGDAGTLDLKKTDGPTGYWGMRTSDATKAFQKKNNLKIDGQINPAGETVKKLGQVLAAALKPKTNATSRPAERGATRDPDTQSAAMDPGLRRGDENGGYRSRPRHSGAGRNPKRTLSDDAISANGRAARYLAGRTGIGDYATFVAGGIETDPDQGIVEAADLIRQTGEQSPTQADELFRRTLDGLGAENAIRLRDALDDTADAADGSETASMDNKPSDTSVAWRKNLEEIDAVYKKDGAQGLIDTYGPALRDRLEDLYAYATDPKNGDKVRKQAFEVLLGVDPTDPDLTDAGLAAVLGSVVSTRAKQGKAVIKAAKGTKPAQSVHMASEKANLYDGPTVDRPFEKDYPHGAQTDKAGNLTHDIDGRPLDPRGHIVGRRTDGIRDTPARGSELNAIAKEGTGRKVGEKRRIDLEGDHGHTTYSSITRKPDEVLIADDLTGTDYDAVLGHEVGHVIDQHAGEIPVPKDIRSELDGLFNTLNNPRRDDLNPGYADMWSKPVTPRDQGYAPEDVERELMAEAIRGYLVNPSYVKEAAPNVAKHIRKWVNEHPELRKIVQFNALPGGIILGTQSDQAPEE